MHAGAVARTGLDQLARVVARPAADHDDDVGLACHLDRRGLPLLGGLADRVDEAHVRLRESPSDQVDQVPHLLYRLRRLGRHAEAWMLLEREDVIVFEHDVEAIEIAGEAAHLHVVALPDDDDVVALAREGRDGAVRDVDERARGFDHRQPQGAGPREGPLGRAVGRHHHGRRLDVCDVLRDRDALRLEGAQDGGVVDEVTEDGEGAGVSVLERERDGIANAETHAEVGGSEDAHTLQYKVYCDSKCSQVEDSVTVTSARPHRPNPSAKHKVPRPRQFILIGVFRLSALASVFEPAGPSRSRGFAARRPTSDRGPRHRVQLVETDYETSEVRERAGETAGPAVPPSAMGQGDRPAGRRRPRRA